MDLFFITAHYHIVHIILTQEKDEGDYKKYLPKVHKEDRSNYTELQCKLKVREVFVYDDGLIIGGCQLFRRKKDAISLATQQCVAEIEGTERKLQDLTNAIHKLREMSR